MLALLRYEPQDRPTIEDALAMIEWVDHRREGGGHEDAEGDEIKFPTQDKPEGKDVRE